MGQAWPPRLWERAIVDGGSQRAHGSPPTSGMLSPGRTSSATPASRRGPPTPRSALCLLPPIAVLSSQAVSSSGVAGWRNAHRSPHRAGAFLLFFLRGSRVSRSAPLFSSLRPPSTAPLLFPPPLPSPVARHRRWPPRLAGCGRFFFPPTLGLPSGARSANPAPHFRPSVFPFPAIPSAGGKQQPGSQGAVRGRSRLAPFPPARVSLFPQTSAARPDPGRGGIRFRDRLLGSAWPASVERRHSNSRACQRGRNQKTHGHSTRWKRHAQRFKPAEKREETHPKA